MNAPTARLHVNTMNTKNAWQDLRGIRLRIKLRRTAVALAEAVVGIVPQRRDSIHETGSGRDNTVKQ
jgi:hypothetical protein